MSKEAMKLALEALECTEYPQDHYDAITALREALNAPLAEQEPVTWCSQCGHKCPQPAPIQQEPVGWWDDKLGFFAEKHFDQLQPIYTSPPAQRTWVGLDNDDLVWIYSNSDNVGQAISNTEAKLKEKNT